MNQTGDVNHIVAKAEELGDLLAAHERFHRLRNAEQAVAGDEQARRLSDELNRHMEHIADLERRQQPVEPEDKRKVEQLRERVHSTPPLQELARAQADFMELMTRVNEAIRAKLKLDASDSKEDSA